jgi:hypothetical protein
MQFEFIRTRMLLRPDRKPKPTRLTLLLHQFVKMQPACLREVGFEMNENLIVLACAQKG